jgi:hypothetical protein
MILVVELLLSIIQLNMCKYLMCSLIYLKNVTPKVAFFSLQVQSFEQVGETQFLTTIHDADNINHIVVFMTGTVPFPQGMGGLG